ncbi:MAG: Uncharacterized protein CEN87_304 [Parcubacteria group bacterium Licking1014_1]|nr:MAG: Uncharacterized protein CEN87_304 [Parcubacteria group bacterium Licking1014_1]
MEKEEKYPQWIDEFAKSVHNSFANMVPGNWGPIDYLAFMHHNNNAFFDKLYKAIKTIKEKGHSNEEIAETFTCPSALRCAFLFLTWEYGFSDPKQKEKFKEIAEFFVDVLSYMMKEDVFCFSKNIAHDKEEINKILETTPWNDSDPKIARELGKLYNSCAALAFSLWRDFFPQISHEVYGPYDASSKFGENTILVMKHFPKLLPKEIWSDLNYEYSDVKIFQIFKNVKFKCEIIGMHTIYEGDIINNNVAYAVVVNDKFVDINQIKEASKNISEITTKQIQIYDRITMDELKRKTLEWECYQFINFFKLAEMDWKPTEEMVNAVKNKNIGERTIMETFPSFDEYINSPEYEIYWLKDLYK